KERPFSFRQPRLRRGVHHPAVVPISEPGPKHVVTDPQLTKKETGRYMVRPHHSYRNGPQHPLSIKFATIAQHPRKSKVVLGGRHHSAASRRQPRLLGVVGR